nr:ribonuclease H-like domain-containing protein [Tanacetum cinerariifolium]
MLKGFDREDLDALWRLVKEKFSLAIPTEDKEKALWVELTRLFEPNADDVYWKLQRYMHDPLTWKLYTICGVHHVSSTRRHDIFMLTEKDYPLSNVVMIMMLSAKLQVEEDSEITRNLVMKIFMEANKPKSRHLDTSFKLKKIHSTRLTLFEHKDLHIEGHIIRNIMFGEVVAIIVAAFHSENHRKPKLRKRDECVEPNGKMIVDSIENGSYIRRMIATPGEPYLPVPVRESFHKQTDKELTENDIKQMDADDQAIQTILLGLPEDVYAVVNSYEAAKEIWECVQQMMKGSDIGE